MALVALVTAVPERGGRGNERGRKGGMMKNIVIFIVRGQNSVIVEFLHL